MSTRSGVDGAAIAGVAISRAAKMKPEKARMK
jgi:hypothetical protein